MGEHRQMYSDNVRTVAVGALRIHSRGLKTTVYVTALKWVVLGCVP